MKYWAFCTCISLKVKLVILVWSNFLTGHSDRGGAFVTLPPKQVTWPLQTLKYRLYWTMQQKPKLIWVGKTVSIITSFHSNPKFSCIWYLETLQWHRVVVIICWFESESDIKTLRSQGTSYVRQYFHENSIIERIHLSKDSSLVSCWIETA